MEKLDTIFRDVELILDDLQSDEAKSARFAEFAGQQIAEVRAANRAAVGGDVPVKVIVDGRAGAPLETVRPNGVVVADFDVMRDMLEWIGEQLVRMSPVLTGRYARSHVLEVDGVEVSLPGLIPEGERYLFVNRQPYARKIEPGRFVRRHRARRGRGKVESVTEIRTRSGQSQQAPDGVYQAVAAVAAHRFGNVAKVKFVWNYFDYETGVSHPAIIVSRY